MYSVTVFTPENRKHYTEDASLSKPTFPALDVDGFKVAVFTLDCRTFKTEWYDGFDIWGTKGEHGDFLGEQQWGWFEDMINQVRRSEGWLEQSDSNLPLNLVLTTLPALASLIALIAERRRC